MINFKESKTSTIEVLAPDTKNLFSKLSRNKMFTVYDPENAYSKKGPSRKKSPLPPPPGSSILMRTTGTGCSTGRSS